MDRGLVEMNSEECKGCGLCTESCPPKVLRLADRLNRYGYHPAEYLGAGCRGGGFSYLAGAELPCVVADFMRGGPGLGNIAPEQSDYNQIVKGGGHGNYRTLVLAPDSVQEMADLTTWAFDLADEYRNPVVVLADGFIGQMMEPVAFAPPRAVPAAPEWAVTGTAETRRNLVSSIYLEPDALECHIRKLEAKYREAGRREVRAECWRTDDADFVLVGYGIVARVLKAVVEHARARGIKAGLLRPIT